MSPTDSLIKASLAATRHFSPEDVRALLEQPTIIVSAPRSGSNLLFELMSKVEGIWTIGRESHAIYNEFPHLRAENAKLDSGSLREAHADRDTRRLLRAIFLYLLRDKHGRPFIMLPAAERPARVKMLEKTPRNALNIPFLLKVFPNAKFILLHREPRANVASLVEAWKVGLQSGRFVTFLDLPGWDRAAWCFLLPPGWRSMIGKSLVEIAAFQWSAMLGKKYLAIMQRQSNPTCGSINGKNHRSDSLALSIAKGAQAEALQQFFASLTRGSITHSPASSRLIPQGNPKTVGG